ncbi:MAG: DUF1045 domain-containing protein [Hyphomicrobiaceae bacterium]
MRYAIYFTPAPDSMLWRLGSSALGYDAVLGQDVPFPTHPLYADPAFLRRLETPRRYGFHATLKAPFALRSGSTERDLLECAAALAAHQTPILVPGLEVTLLGDFLALRPATEHAELNRLAATAVRELDHLRIALTDADRARRLAASLTTRQVGHLDRWGYPYIFEDFRFHLTLSGALAEPMRAPASTALKALFSQAMGALQIDALSVLVQPTPQSRFVVIERLPLQARAAPTEL